MAPESLQDILPFVERPSRYLGTEINRIRKNPQKVKLRFALAFPDLYEIGTSHFGLQILYSILNERKEIAAERFFQAVGLFGKELDPSRFRFRNFKIKSLQALQAGTQQRYQHIAWFFI